MTPSVHFAYPKLERLLSTVQVAIAKVRWRLRVRALRSKHAPWFVVADRHRTQISLRRHFASRLVRRSYRKTFASLVAPIPADGESITASLSNQSGQLLETLKVFLLGSSGITKCWSRIVPITPPEAVLPNARIVRMIPMFDRTVSGANRGEGLCNIGKHRGKAQRPA